MLKKLYIEPTTKCNLNCKMCFRNTWFDEPICDLSLEDYRRVLADMPKSVETVFFGGMGEPLFHKDILEMIKLASISLGISFVAMRSNIHQLGKLPFFIAQHLVDEVNVSNISPTDEASQNEMLYTGLVNMYTGPGKDSILPTVHLPFFDMNIPESAEGIRALMQKQNFNLYFNGQPVLRKTAYCKFAREGMCFVRSDGKVSPCMALLHNAYTYMSNVRRKIYHSSFGSIKEKSLSEIWNSDEYKSFRRKFDNFDFSPCMYCGHCERFSDNTSDCFGNTHPTCGGCLWAEGVLSCP